MFCRMQIPHLPRHDYKNLPWLQAQLAAQCETRAKPAGGLLAAPVSGQLRKESGLNQHFDIIRNVPFFFGGGVVFQSTHKALTM